MQRRTLFLPVLSLLAILGRAQVNTPEIGFARFKDKSVRAIRGISANLVVDRLARGSADALSFSDRGGLTAKDGTIQLRGPDYSLIAEYNAGEAAPLLNIDGDLTTAIAWLPARRALLHWDGKAFDLIETSMVSLGSVSAVWKQDSKSARLLVVEPGGAVSEASLSLATGNLIGLQLLPGVRGAAFHQHSLVLFLDKQGLEIASPGGNLRTLPLRASDLKIEHVSSDWLHLDSPASKQSWMLHLNSATIELSELPAFEEAQP